MKSLKLRTIIIISFICSIMLSCGTLQQPLPGSLWGDWSFVKTGNIDNNGNERLYNYRNICYEESDRLSFRSDDKLSLRWYDESCTINYYFIGRYHVENNILKVDLENDPRYQDSPFPSITEYRIVQINATTLKLVEIPEDSGRNRRSVRPDDGPLVFVFMRLD